jgi:transcriptional regulator PpsR
MLQSAGATFVNSHCPPGCVDAGITSRVIAAASDLALVVDHQGVIEDVSIGDAVQSNPAWNKLVGKRWIETIGLESKPKVDQLLREARAGQVTRAREINQHAEGSSDVLFRFSAVLLDGQQRVVAMGRDLRAISTLQQQMISSQQAMDREYGRLRQAETRYRLLFQVSSEGVVVADAASLRVLETNPAAAALLEESAHALQGRTLQDLFESPSWPVVQALLAAVDSGGRPSDVQVNLLSQGREVTVSASLFRQSGSTLLLLRLRPAGVAQAPAGSRESRILAVIAALPDSFVVIGEDRRILCANSAFCDLVQQANENQIVGQPLDRWLGRPGVDLNIMLANLREHGTVRNFATIVRGEYEPPQEAVVSAVSALDAKVPCLGFSIRTVPARLSVVPSLGPIPRSVDQLRELVGRVSLKEIVRESADLIERLCIEAALQVSGDNRASAAQLLGLSRQGLYSKLRRHGLGDLDPTEQG